MLFLRTMRMEYKSVEPISEDRDTNNIFKPFTKLWIVDCLRMPLHPTVENSYLFHNLIVENVDVFGVISGRKLIGTSVAIYTVDDGTGFIKCVYDHGRQGVEEDCRKIKNLKYELSGLPGFTKREHDMFNHMMKSAINTYENLIEYREIGDTVHVTGRLKTYRDVREVKAYHVSLVRDLNNEIDRINELMLLYENGYKNKDKPRNEFIS